MAKPPVDVNPEKFIIGRGAYTNLRTAVPFADSKEFRIDPAPMPFTAIVIINTVFVAFFGAFYWALSTYSNASETIISIATIGIGTMTCVLFTAITCYSFYKARKDGPWLVVDKLTENVSLPREGVEFHANDVVHIQCITTKRLDLGGIVNNDQLSEINLVTCVDGERKRWPILRSIFNVKAFDYIIEPLLKSTNVPVVRIVDERLDWDTTETTLHSSRLTNYDPTHRPAESERG